MKKHLPKLSLLLLLFLPQFYSVFSFGEARSCQSLFWTAEKRDAINNLTSLVSKTTANDAKSAFERELRIFGIIEKIANFVDSNPFINPVKNILRNQVYRLVEEIRQATKAQSASTALAKIRKDYAALAQKTSLLLDEINALKEFFDNANIHPERYTNGQTLLIIPFFGRLMYFAKNRAGQMFSVKNMKDYNSVFEKNGTGSEELTTIGNLGYFDKLGLAEKILLYQKKLYQLGLIVDQFSVYQSVFEKQIAVGRIANEILKKYEKANDNAASSKTIKLSDLNISGNNLKRWLEIIEQAIKDSPIADVETDLKLLLMSPDAEVNITQLRSAVEIKKVVKSILNESSLESIAKKLETSLGTEFTNALRQDQTIDHFNLSTVAHYRDKSLFLRLGSRISIIREGLKQFIFNSFSLFYLKTALQKLTFIVTYMKNFSKPLPLIGDITQGIHEKAQSFFEQHNLYRFSSTFLEIVTVINSELARISSVEELNFATSGNDNIFKNNSRSIVTAITMALNKLAASDRVMFLNYFARCSDLTRYWTIVEKILAEENSYKDYLSELSKKRSSGEFPTSPLALMAVKERTWISVLNLPILIEGVNLALWLSGLSGHDPLSIELLSHFEAFRSSINPVRDIVGQIQTTVQQIPEFANVLPKEIADPIKDHPMATVVVGVGGASMAAKATTGLKQTLEDWLLILKRQPPKESGNNKSEDNETRGSENTSRRGR